LINPPPEADIIAIEDKFDPGKTCENLRLPFLGVGAVADHNYLKRPWPGMLEDGLDRRPQDIWAKILDDDKRDIHFSRPLRTG
jgi:hypothetical protein